MNTHLPIQGQNRDQLNRLKKLNELNELKTVNPRTRGAALMMTLIMLVILSILITGFVVSMRTELAVAYSNENIQRTKMVAQAAVVHGIDLLRSNIPDPATITAAPGDQTNAPARNWISNPGRLIVDLGGSAEQIIDLHTGTQHDGDDLTSFDLNQPLAGETAAAIVAVDSGARPKMRVSWHNILQDPSKDPGAPLENGDVNAITGRYAFWMDDETSKINFNVASGKDVNAWRWLEDEWLVPDTLLPRGRVNNNTGNYAYNINYSLGHPATVNLNHLFDEETLETSNQFDRGRLATHIYTNGWHQFPEAIMEYYDFDGDPEVIDPSEQDWYDKNRWNLTFYSRSPEFNVFGKSRYFTTLNPLAIEGGPAYQMPFTADRILHLHTLFGGLEHNPNEALTNLENHKVLLQYFQRDDWPGYSGSFEDKWGGEKSAFQVGLNIIQMGIIGSGFLTETTARGNSEHRFALDFSRDMTDGSRNDASLGRFPRREFWRDDDENLYLPQMPGPHLSEVHFDLFAEEQQIIDRKPRYKIWIYNIGWRWSVEYFMHDNGWVVPTLGVTRALDAENLGLSPFPTTIDFLRMRCFVDDKPLNGRSSASPEKQNVDFRWINDIRGTRSALYQGSWHNRHHTETLIDLGDPDNLAKKFVIAPLDPPRNAAVPGVPVRSSNIQVAMSDKFYIQGGSGNGNWRLGFISEDDLANGQVPHEFKVRESYNRDGSLQETYGEPITISFDVRVGMATSNRNFRTNDSEVRRLTSFSRPKQMVPMGDSPTRQPNFNRDLAPTPMDPKPGEALSITPISIPDIRQWGGASFGWECMVDPRIARSADPSHWAFTSRPKIDSQVSFGYNQEAHSKFRHLQVGWSPNSNAGDNNVNGNKTRITTDKLSAARIRNRRPYRGNRAFNENYRFTSPGYYSLVHTGQQVDAPYRTLNLQSEAADSSIYGGSGPPDYVLFDLFAPSFCFDQQQWTNARRLPDSWSAISYMNSTAGQINLNSRIYPDDGGGDFNPPPRLKPLEAVFVHLRENRNFAIDFASNIDAYQESEPFAYVGQLAEVQGYVDPKLPGSNPQSEQFRREEILRNMMPCLTTKSNTFGLWGAAQTVRKSPSNLRSTPERFEEGDQVLGEKRFFALIERYIWTGRDGAPGNAHVDASGIWDRLSQPRFRTEGQIVAGDFVGSLHDIPGAPPNVNPNNNFRGSGIQFAEFDGPDPVDMDNAAKLALADAVYSQSTLEEAYNPPHPVMKYRVVYFKYLDQ